MLLKEKLKIDCGLARENIMARVLALHDQHPKIPLNSSRVIPECSQEKALSISGYSLKIKFPPPPK